MNLLFLSDDDLVRGPMARALAQRRAAELHLFGQTFDSCGISVEHSAGCHAAVVGFLRGQGLDASRHASKPLTATLARQADVIFAMTHRLAEQARKTLGPSLAGRVVQINEAVGLGRGGRMDVTPPMMAHSALLAVYSQLKATTGRIVRRLEDGRAAPEHFGAAATERSGSVLDDARARRLFARYVLEVVAEAFEPPTTDQVQSALELLGRRLSSRELDRLLAEELAPRIVVERPKNRWRYVPDSSEPPCLGGRAAPPPREEPRARLDPAEAFVLLGITKSTPPAEAQRIYRRALMRYHPDRFHDDAEFRALAERKTRLLNAAWEIASGLLKD